MIAGAVSYTSWRYYSVLMVRNRRRPRFDFSYRSPGRCFEPWECFEPVESGAPSSTRLVAGMAVVSFAAAATREAFSCRGCRETDFMVYIDFEGVAFQSD